MNRLLVAGFSGGLSAALAGPALAQTAPAPARVPTDAPAGTVVVREGDNTGGGGNTMIAPGATGASTIETNSAAVGNAGQPERRVPPGSAGGSGAQ